MLLFGPFSQLITLNTAPIQGGGIQVQDDTIVRVGIFSDLEGTPVPVPECSLAVPGFIDAHTHTCYAGSRAADYAMRLEGKSYLEIAKKGGGILQTVKKTRAASIEDLTRSLEGRLKKLLSQGVTTCEIKSGYGLDAETELKMLKSIQKAKTPIQKIPTCLAAHTCPPGYTSKSAYLNMVLKDILPQVLGQGLSRRVDIFVEETAFSMNEAYPYLSAAKEMGFSLTIHGDQFTRGSATLAAKVRAQSMDHLEVSTVEDAKTLKEANVRPIVLPGATLGLGLPFPPARMLLDQGLELAIASDWNPGSASMGKLLTGAALLGAAQKLSVEETLRGITCNAAKALGLWDRGYLKGGMRADFVVFPTTDYREIFYYQGSLEPSHCCIGGVLHAC